MGLLTPLPTMLSTLEQRALDPSSSSANSSELQWFNLTRLSSSIRAKSWESRSLSDQLKQDQIWWDRVFTQAMGCCGQAKGISVFVRETLQDRIIMMMNFYWYYWNKPSKVKIGFILFNWNKLNCIYHTYTLYSENYLPVESWSHQKTLNWSNWGWECMFDNY